MAATVGPDGRTQYVYTISGVRVEFPVKAYPSQIAMMDKVSRLYAFRSMTDDHLHVCALISLSCRVSSINQWPTWRQRGWRLLDTLALIRITSPIIAGMRLE
jgi:hypothetical protein